MEVASCQHAVTVRHDDHRLAEIVAEAADLTGRPARALHLQTLLQAPRLADRSGIAGRNAVDSLVLELAAELPPASAWDGPSASSVHDLRFGRVSAEQAETITRRYHYLRSPRTDGTADGLVDHTGFAAALCIVSPLDVASISELLADLGHQPATTAVVSRVFAFDGAPRNSLSYLLAWVCTTLRHQDFDAVVTYVNPNMGFTGVSYRASGWTPLGTEPGTHYQYLDGRYVTARQLATTYGSRSRQGYRELLERRYSESTLHLEPLRVPWRPLKRRGPR